MKTIALALLLVVASFGVMARDEAIPTGLYCNLVAMTYNNALYGRDHRVDPKDILAQSSKNILALDEKKFIINRAYFDPQLEMLTPSENTLSFFYKTCIASQPSPFKPLE